MFYVATLANTGIFRLRILKVIQIFYAKGVCKRMCEKILRELPGKITGLGDFFRGCFAAFHLLFKLVQVFWKNSSSAADLDSFPITDPLHYPTGTQRAINIQSAKIYPAPG